MSDYLTAASSATLTGQQGHSALQAARFSSRGFASLATGGVNFTANDPYQLTGLSGTIVIPAATGAARGGRHFVYTTPFSGTLRMAIASPEGLLVDYVVLVDGEETQRDLGGSLDLTTQSFENVRFYIAPPSPRDLEIDPEEEIAAAFGQIEPTPEPVEGSVDDDLIVEWSFAQRPSTQLFGRLLLEEIGVTPASLELTLSNAVPHDTLTFSLEGDPEILGQVQADDFGELETTFVDLPALDMGEYVLLVESIASGSITLPFTVVEDPLTYGDDDFSEPTRPQLQVQRWTFVDLRDSQERWTMQRNPAAWSNLNPPNDFTHQPTTAPDGQILTYEAGSRPWRIEFTGFIDDEDEYQRFVYWSSLRRRLWLIDHRDRAWLLTIEHFDVRHRIEPTRPWAHDYTVRALVFKRD